MYEFIAIKGSNCYKVKKPSILRGAPCRFSTIAKPFANDMSEILDQHFIAQMSANSYFGDGLIQPEHGRVVAYIIVNAEDAMALKLLQ